ncbi:MAG: Crp/Fnr family transcriptional regulator [Candidatus Omnitrophota bacterium]
MILSLKNVPLFQGLSPSELSAVKDCLIEKTFEKGDVLFLEGNLCERVFIVREGRVKVYRTSSAGREQILETLGPGDTCACNPGLSEWHCASSAEAFTPCKVWFLSRENYVRMVQTNAKVSQALNKLFAERLSHSEGAS